MVQPLLETSAAPALPSDRTNEYTVRPAQLERLLSMRQVCYLTSLHRRTIERKMEKGTFPKSIPISEGRYAFRASDVAEWLTATMMKFAS